MKQLTRKEVEAVVERLADKTLSFGCKIIIDGRDAVITKTNSGTYFFSGRTLIEQGLRHSPLLERATIVGHAVLIGNVLEKIETMKIIPDDGHTYIQRDRFTSNLLGLWSDCTVDGKSAISRSLQEICEASGWESKGHTDICINCHHDVIPCVGKCDEEVLTSPEANALFTFLQEIL